MNNKYYIWLSYLESIDIIKLNLLLKEFKTVENLYNVEDISDIKIYIDSKIISKKDGEMIVDKDFKKKIDMICEKLNKEGIYNINYTEKEYPEILKNIYDYPISIYAKGNIELLNCNNKIAIIGSRDYTEYGKNACEYFTSKLAKKMIIVSGLARGIDSIAHRKTLESKGLTIGVLGNGLDYIYPPENKKLEDEIINKNGLIITEYPIGRRPSKYTFPLRNRIISGISDKLLIVEAKKRSGTLITAEFALEQGKEIYCIPGNINDKNFEGTNNLIKEGAILVNTIEDIIDN